MIPYVILAAALVGLFLALVVLRRLYDRRWNRGLGVTLAFRDRTAVEGSTTALREVIVNDKRLPLPAVDIDFQLDRNLRFADGQNVSVSDKTYRRDIFALNGRQKITRTLALECLGRGTMRSTGWASPAGICSCGRSTGTASPSTRLFMWRLIRCPPGKYSCLTPALPENC